MKRLKKEGYPVYGLSNWSLETFPYVRQKYNFFELLDDIIICGEVGSVKPEPEIFETTLGRIGRPAHECLFIDDSLQNSNQARSMGFVTVHFKSAQQLARIARAEAIVATFPSGRFHARAAMIRFGHFSNGHSHP